MKAMLVIPPWKLHEIRSKDTQKIAGAWPPLGLMYIGAVLQKYSFPLRVLDGLFYSNDQFLSAIGQYEPDFLGIFVITPFWKKARKLIGNVKKILPGNFVAIGGHYPSAMREQCFSEAPMLDAVVINEGEYATLEILTRLSNRDTLEGVKGTIIRNGNKIISNPLRPLIDPLDQLPMPAIELFPWENYQPSYGQVSRLPAFQMISSRGCSNNCLYCYKMFGKTIRMRNPEHVVAEMECYAKKFGAREIKFWDESFTYDRSRVIRICKEIIRKKLNIAWWVSARADMVDDHLLHMMKKSGCWCINFGVETAIQKNLDTLRKNLTVKQIAYAVNMAHRAGIRTYLTYIFGTPGETYEEGLRTIELATRLNSFYAEFFPITPWPGTDLWKNNSYGHVICNISEMTMLQDKVPFVPHSMSEKEIKNLLGLAYKKFYLRPGYILQRICLIRTWYQIKVLLYGGLAMVSMLFMRKTSRSQ